MNKSKKLIMYWNQFEKVTTNDNYFLGEKGQSEKEKWFSRRKRKRKKNEKKTQLVMCYG